MAQVGYPQVRPEGEAEHLGSQAGCQGVAVGRQAAMGIGPLLVRRDRVMDQGADACGGQLALERIAPRVADDEQMPDGLGPVGHLGQNQSAIGQSRQVGLG